MTDESDDLPSNVAPPIAAAQVGATRLEGPHGAALA
jgi:hypothetical protein